MGFYINVSETNLSNYCHSLGIISYNDDITDTLDNAQVFKTIKDCQKYLAWLKKQSSWDFEGKHFDFIPVMED